MAHDEKSDSNPTTKLATVAVHLKSIVLNMVHDDEANGLKLLAQNIETDQIFENKFSIQQLKQCGFMHSKSIVNIMKLIQSAFDGIETSLKMTVS